MLRKVFSIADIAFFIYQNKNKTHMENWTLKQVCTYVQELIEDKHIVVADDGQNIVGAVLYNPEIQGNFWVNQIWAENKNIVRNFLQALKIRFPNVDKIYGRRRRKDGRHSVVVFKLKSLEKIYGW